MSAHHTRLLIFCGTIIISAQAIQSRRNPIPASAQYTPTRLHISGDQHEEFVRTIFRTDVC